jgi:hypothetical protein
MSTGIVPESFIGVLAAFAGCFGAPSYRTFEAVIVGWVHCLGRRTITAVALASGAVGRRHISGFHRFFSRAVWSLDDLGRILFGLAVAWIPAEQPLYLVIDDTLARKGGKGVALASMHHDPLLSTARKPFFSFGHVWVVLALWVPLPMGGARGFALPVLFRLYVGTKRGGQRDAPSRATAGVRLRAAEAAHPPASRRPTKLELARELIGLVATWAGDRTLYAVVDSAYAGQELLRGRPPDRPRHQPPAHGRRALDPPPAAPPRSDRAPAQAGQARAGPPSVGGRVATLADPAPHALRAAGHPPRLRADRSLVRRLAGAPGPHRRGPRPDGTTPGRGLLLHRPQRG